MIKLIETKKYYLIEFKENKLYQNSLFYKSLNGFYFLYNTNLKKIQEISKFISQSIININNKLYIQKYYLEKYKNLMSRNGINYRIYNNSYNLSYDRPVFHLTNSRIYNNKRIIKITW